jgi:hypothetical protein
MNAHGPPAKEKTSIRQQVCNICVSDVIQQI